MKKAIAITLACFLLLIKISYSLIDVGVAESLKGNISSITYDNTSNIVKFSVEFYNTGSVGYKARIKNEIYDNDSRLIFNAWSQENSLMPGERKTFDTYWFSDDSGKYYSKFKVYFGNEILEYRKFEFSIGESISPEDVFEIRNLRTYDDHIIFDIQSIEGANDVIIMPNRYIHGWIFEQGVVTNVTKNSSKTVVIKYYPTLWMPSNISLSIASDDGAYYSERVVEMKKNEGLMGFFFYIIDSFRMAFLR